MSEIPETIPMDTPQHESTKILLEWAATGAVRAMTVHDEYAHRLVWVRPQNLTADPDVLHSAFEVAWSKHRLETPSRESCWAMMRDFIEEILWVEKDDD